MERGCRRCYYCYYCWWLLLVLLMETDLVAPARATDQHHSSLKEGSNRSTGELTMTERLKNHLLWDYDHTSRPASHNVTVVRLQMVFTHVALDQNEGTMTTTGWMRMYWWDQRLRWNDSEYDGLQVVQADVTEIWHPEIFLYNSALDVDDATLAHTPCLFYPNGEAMWVAPCEYHVFCDFNLRRWPFDTQTCHIRLGSWTYNNVDFRLKSVPSEVALLDTSSEWQLLEVKGSRQERQYPMHRDPVVEIEYVVTCRRRSPTYTAVVLAPAAVIVVMTLTVFWMPPEAGEKIALASITSILTCIFLLDIALKVPSLAGYTPLIVVFYGATLYLVCASLIASVILINMSTNKRTSPPPRYLGALLTGKLAALLRLKAPSTLARQIEEVQDTDEHAPLDTDAMTSWRLLCAVFNRLLFALYCVVFLLLGVILAT